MEAWSQATEDQGLARSGAFDAPTWHMPTSPVAQGKQQREFSLPALLLTLTGNSSSEEDGLCIRAREN